MSNIQDNPPSDSKDTPSLDDFISWRAEDVRPLVSDKTIVFSPGGSSRWYFLEHGDIQVGYTKADHFSDYAQRGIQRTLEIANMIFADGIRTVFVVGIMPGQLKRDAMYTQNLASVVSYIANQTAQELYAKYQIGVLFRGAWEWLFEQLGTRELHNQCIELEQQTTAKRDRWLIWLTQDDPLPRSLAPLIAESLQKTGQLPDQMTLSRTYYGRPLSQVDIFISHNKPTLMYQLPSLLPVGDVYFTVLPSYYLGLSQWRRILYDHLFERRRISRDYSEIESAALGDLRAFYVSNKNTIQGVGFYHAQTQSWRPILHGNVEQDVVGEIMSQPPIEQKENVD